jgi:AcrR family transcriptional regulator
MPVPTRRERLRTATVAEIKEGARRLLVTGGPQAISLRAIARDMGMTAPAIYRYFPSLEALIVQLAGDLLDELRETIEQARDADGGDPIGQLTAMARAFRLWSVRHPKEFALIFGPPVPGMAEFIEDCDENHPGARLGAAFIQPMIELWHQAPFHTPPRELVEQRLSGCLDPLRQSQGDVPLEVAYMFLSGWARLHGLVSMEVFHQLQWAVTEPEALFETELASLAQQLAPDQATAAPGSAAG